MPLNETIPFFSEFAITEWGIVGAFVCLSIALVVIFLNYMKERDKIVLSVHESCERRISDITNSCITAIHENTLAVKDLEAQIKLLNSKLSIQTS